MKGDLAEGRFRSHADDITREVARFHETHHYSPSLREVASAINLSVSRTCRVVERMAAENLIVYEPGRARTLRPVTGPYFAPVEGSVWCDSHCGLHPRQSDYYEEGQVDCAPVNWRAVYVGTEDPAETF